ncbi:hypothetical protein [Marinimicrobium locisalis]|uniref:hypothetical protein n=1 Tax=Marinimicrobium locisalis TaxID=546022 RepID=UPI0032217159
MKVGIKYAVFLIAPIYALTGCVAMANKSEGKWFNQEEFIGLEDMSSSYSALTLAYELDGQDGELIEFGGCKDVEDTAEADVVQSQFPLFKKLYINCMGAKYFHMGSVAEKDYLPDDFNPKLVNQIPASAVPNRGGTSLEASGNRPLAEMQGVKVVNTEDRVFTLNVETTEVDYVLLSEVDANNDGFQDWVLRLDWSQSDSFGEGTDLIVLTKRAKSGEMEVLIRHP